MPTMAIHEHSMQGVATSMMTSAISSPLANITSVSTASLRGCARAREDANLNFPTDSTRPLDAESDLARIARLIRSNERLLAEMQSLRARIDLARAYLREPGCHTRLGASYLDRWRFEDRP